MLVKPLAMVFPEACRGALAYAPYLCAILVLWLGFSPVARYKLRHIPGPAGWPFLGNLVPLTKEHQHRYFLRLRRKYGPIFKVWVGTDPWIVVAEPEAVRKLANKINNHDQYPHTLAGEEQYILEHTLLFLRNEEWRQMKKAWDPSVLHRASLQGYAPLMQECSDELVQRLEGVRQRGEVVDIWVELSKMTLNIVGTCAFGINFSKAANEEATAVAQHSPTTTTTSNDNLAQLGVKLRGSCMQFFRSMQFKEASAWLLPTLMFPAYAAVFRKLAYLLPDKGQLATSQTMQQMLVSARTIIGATKEQRQQQEAPAGGATATGAEEAPAGGAAATGAKEEPAGAAEVGANCQTGAARGVLPGRFVAQLDTAATAAQAVKKPAATAVRLQGVLPGSFVAQLEAWRAKHGAGLDISDNLLAAQVITFLLAGYETTANALGFFIYLVSVNSEVQQKVQAELDSVLGGRKPTLDDLPKLVYLEACLKESLRIMGPTSQFGRIFDNSPGNPAALDLLGFRIPRNSKVFSLTYALHRDPQYWERPEEFLPERFLPETKGKLGPFHEYAYLPFGAGGRRCPGYKFAEQEMKLVGAALLQRFTFSRPPEAGPQETESGLTVGPKGGVQVLVAGRS